MGLLELVFTGIIIQMTNFCPCVSPLSFFLGLIYFVNERPISHLIAKNFVRFSWDAMSLNYIDVVAKWFPRMLVL